MMLEPVGKPADYQNNGLKSSQGYPVLGVHHGEAEHRRGKEVVKTAGGEHRSNAGFEPSPSECDEDNGQKV